MRTDSVVIGAGHAGLAMSRRLTERSIDHVVLERGEVANSWRTQRWASLRLLTPTWMSRLPGADGVPGDPDGFMSTPEVVTMLASYATGVDAPVRPATEVERVAPAPGGGYDVTTNQGRWRARTVVIATGACALAHVPPVAAAIPSAVRQVTALSYRSPDELPEGGVLVVGASATGVQLAEEIRRSGRPVTLAVGEHVRLPRRYRGRDVMWWLDAAGILDERWDEVDDLTRARHVPSPQLIGSADGRSLDLNALADLGVRIVGRLVGIRDGVAQCSGALRNTIELADLKLRRLLRRLDEWAVTADAAVDGPEAIAPTRLPAAPVLGLDLRTGEIATIVWATGYRPDHRWLDVPVLDRRGRIAHQGGVTSAPGLYVLGGTLARTRRSSYIDGAAADTAALAMHVSGVARPP